MDNNIDNVIIFTYMYIYDIMKEGMSPSFKTGYESLANDDITHDAT